MGRGSTFKGSVEKTALAARVAGVDLEFPRAVEVEPRGAVALGAWMLGLGDVGRGGEGSVEETREVLGSFSECLQLGDRGEFGKEWHSGFLTSSCVLDEAQSITATLKIAT